VVRDFWKDKQVLITGCTGFLGSWLTLQLVELGASVTGVVRDKTPKMLGWGKLFDRINQVESSVTEAETMRRVFSEYQIDTCFHLAAQSIVTIAKHDPISTFESNIRGTWIILETARKCASLERLVIASTDKAYGMPKYLPYDEDHALQGEYPYDVSKTCADLLAHAYFRTYWEDVTLPHRVNLGITRCANIFGGGDFNFRRFVPEKILEILSGQVPTVRWGGVRRDFLYVLDAVRGYLALAENLDKEGITGEAFNFSYGRALPLSELTQILLKTAGKPLSVNILDKGAPEHEIPNQELSCAKAEERLAWVPQFTLEQALGETIKWYAEWISRGGEYNTDMYDYNRSLVSPDSKIRIDD